MVLKFLTAGLITAAIAGGAVYYGLDEDALSALSPDSPATVSDVEDKPIEVAKKKPIETSADNEAQFAILLAETAKLDIVDARNDAYLNILDLAIAKEQYGIAQEIVDDITVPELRDTARQRIGISHAQAGRLEEAFAVLDDLDIEALSDPIRLEIIRSVSRQER